MMRFLWLFLFSVLFSACHHTTHQQKILLSRADSLMQSQPDTALRLLQSLQGIRTLTTPDHARYALLMSQALDKNDVQVTSDSLIRFAADYFAGKDPVRAGYAWFYLSRCKRNQGDVEGQTKALLKAMEFADKSKDFRLKGFVLSDKAALYAGQSELDSMQQCNYLAFQALQKVGDKRNSTACLLSIGYGYYRRQLYDKALDYYRNALDEAEKAGDPLLVTSVYRQIGVVFYCQKKYRDALHYARLSTAVSDMYDYSKWINIAMIYSRLGAVDSAAFYLRKCDNPREMASEYYQTQLEIAIQNKQYKAIGYYMNRLIDVKDSLYRHYLLQSFAGLEKKYKYERYQTENKTLQIESQRNRNGILLLLLVICIISTISLIMKNRHKRATINHQLQLMAQDKIMLAKEQEQNALLTKYLETQQIALQGVNHQKKTMEIQIRNENRPAKIKEQQQQLEYQKYAGASITQGVIENVNTLHHHFIHRLATKYPSLTRDDILFCSLLLLGSETAEIAAILQIKPESINKRRFRLRKKMGLAHDDSLVDFLAKF